MMRWLAMLLLVMGAFAAQPAAAQAPAPVLQGQVEKEKPVYSDTSLGNLIKSMLRMGAQDPSDAEVLNDYAKVHECKIYQQNYQNDFKMARLREGIAKIIQRDRLTWPNAFQFVVPMQLDEYDFGSGLFLLSRLSKLNNVNSFSIQDKPNDICLMRTTLKRFPYSVSVRLDQPVTILGLPIDKKDGEALLARMMQEGNEKRVVYARISIVVSFMPKMENVPMGNEIRAPDKYLFDGNLRTIEFFEDKELTKPIWSLTR